MVGFFEGGKGKVHNMESLTSTVTSITLVLCKIQNYVTLCKTLGGISGYVVMRVRRTEMFCGGSVIWICFILLWTAELSDLVISLHIFLYYL